MYFSFFKNSQIPKNKFGNLLKPIKPSQNRVKATSQQIAIPGQNRDETPLWYQKSDTSISITKYYNK